MVKDKAYMQKMVLQVFGRKQGHELVKQYFVISCHEVKKPNSVSLKDLFDVMDLPWLSWHYVVICEKADTDDMPQVDAWLQQKYVLFLHNQALLEAFWTAKPE